MLAVGVALGGLDARAQSACEPPAVSPGDVVSVAWIAPASARVGAEGWLTVLPTDTLRAVAAAHPGDLAGFLRATGHRRSARPPRQPWVVGVFEVPRPYLCRGLDAEAGKVVGGLAACDVGDRALGLADDGCGATRDLSGGAARLPVLRVRWSHAAARGFCVLPAARFLAGPADPP